jgi:hypothetical protein
MRIQKPGLIRAPSDSTTEVKFRDILERIRKIKDPNGDKISVLTSENNTFNKQFLHQITSTSIKFIFDSNG